jgi:hypothetical protein
LAVLAATVSCNSRSRPARGDRSSDEGVPAQPSSHVRSFAENAVAFRAAWEGVFEDSFSESEIEAYLDGPKSARASAEATSALRELRACLEEARKGGRDLEDFRWGRVSTSISRGIEPTDGERLAHKARRLCLEPALQTASQLCSGEPVDVAARWEEWSKADPTEMPLPQTHDILAVPAIRYLTDSAIDLALEGRAEEAVARVGIAFEGTRKIELIPWTWGFRSWAASVLLCLNSLQAVLPRVPRAVPLTDLVGHLDPGMPRLGLLHALEGDRRIADRQYARVYEPMRSPDSDDDSGTASAISFAKHDREVFDRILDSGVGLARMPYWKATSSDPSNLCVSEKEAATAPLACLLLPKSGEMVAVCAEIEAQILLARSALTAHHDGTDAGVRAAGSSIDPFSGQPLHCRIEPDGTLLLWSVGRNLVDDGGISGDRSELTPKDLVWSIPAR